MKKRRITLNLDEEVVEALEAVAAAEKRSVSAVAGSMLAGEIELAAHRAALLSWLDELDAKYGAPSAEDLAEADAFLDAVESARSKTPRACGGERTRSAHERPDERSYRARCRLVRCARCSRRARAPHAPAPGGGTSRGHLLRGSHARRSVSRSGADEARRERASAGVAASWSSPPEQRPPRRR